MKKYIKSLLKLLLYNYFYRKTNKIDNSNFFGFGSKIKYTQWGKNSICNSDCIIVDTIIGNYTNIAWDVIIGPRSHIYTNFTTHDFPYYENQEHIYSRSRYPFDGYLNRIGHDVWIGCRTIIMPGVEIGNGAIIAAGSVVTKSIPPYALVGGNPAKFIKWRFSEEKIKNLEKTSWYLLDLKVILERKVELQEIVGFDLDQFKSKYYSSRSQLSIDSFGDKHD